jgi:hypothetical protein
MGSGEEKIIYFVSPSKREGREVFSPGERESGIVSMQPLGA